MRTHAKAFASGISITGLPLVAENCGVHAGLIKSGEFVYFLVHDLLHNQSLAPSIDPEVNIAHVSAMVKATNAALLQIEKLSMKKQKAAYGLLFLLNHELVDCSDDDVKLFNGKESAQEVFTAMLEHSKTYVAGKMHKALDSQKTYYPYYFDVIDRNESSPLIGDKPFTVHNEDGSKDTYLDKTFKDYAELTGLPVDESSLLSALFTENIFYSWPVQRAFIYSQVKILKFAGIDDGEETYGSTLEKFKPSVANKIILELLTNFDILEK